MLASASSSSNIDYSTGPYSTSTVGYHDWDQGWDPGLLLGPSSHDSGSAAFDWLHLPAVSQQPSNAHEVPAPIQVQPSDAPRPRRVKNYTPYLSPSPTPSTSQVLSSPPSRMEQPIQPVSMPKTFASKRKARNDSDADYDDDQNEDKDRPGPRKRQATHTSSSRSAGPILQGASIMRTSLSGKASTSRVRRNAKQSRSVFGLCDRRFAAELDDTIPGWILSVIAKSSKGRMPCLLCGGENNPTTIDRHVLTVHRRKLAEKLLKKKFKEVEPREYITGFYFVIADACATEGYETMPGEDDETRDFLRVHGQEWKEGDFELSRYPILQDRCKELCKSICSTFVCHCGQRFGRRDAMNRHQKMTCKLRTAG